MESFVKKIFEGKRDEEVHSQFIRFGKGNYRRRFLINFIKGTKIKVKSSFEYANDFVEFVNENKDLEFSGKILTKKAVSGKDGKKKAGSFVYEISKSSIKEFENVYFYLLDANDSDIVLKIKKSLPKPGKDAEKIDDKFCTLELGLKYWDSFKDAFFWDVPDGKKVDIEHELVIEEIEIPKGEKDPAVMREKAIRKGKIIRKMNIDGKEKIVEKDFSA